jgi:hypothetical protein
VLNIDLGLKGLKTNENAGNPEKKISLGLVSYIILLLIRIFDLIVILNINANWQFMFRYIFGNLLSGKTYTT